MNPAQDTENSQFTNAQMKRLEKRFASLAGAQVGDSRAAITKAVFCCQPEVSTNVFVGAYIDRILERQLSDGTNAHGDDTGHNNKQATGKKSKHLDALISFDDFVHVFWVFSSLASRSDKEEVLEVLLNPDENGWVDQRSMFWFAKCMLPSAPERALEGVVDGFMHGLGAEKDEGQPNGSSSWTMIPIDKFFAREDFVDRLTIHI